MGVCVGCASGLYQGATLSRNGDFISLTDGDIIPLRFDGKTYYLDYFVSKSATDDGIVRFTDAVYSSPVGSEVDDDSDTVGEPLRSGSRRDAP